MLSNGVPSLSCLRTLGYYYVEPGVVIGKAQESIATEEVPAPWFRGRPANRWPLARLRRCHAPLPRRE